MLIRVNIERVQTQQIILEVEGDELESLKQQKLASPAFFTILNRLLELQKRQIMAICEDSDWETTLTDISSSHRTGIVDADEGLVAEVTLAELLSEQKPQTTLF
jgi:uncharacterized protein with von Willebrand factor type A (vWA) domain